MTLPEATENKSLMRSKTHIETMDEALAWAVNTLDQDFQGATMVKMSVEQFMFTEAMQGAEWKYGWQAMVSGSLPIEEATDASPTD